jgi:hypothetical protein
MATAVASVSCSRRLRARAAAVVWCVALFSSACASVSVDVPVATAPPAVVPWEQKADWIIRLEDQRILRNPNAPPPALLSSASGTRPAVPGPEEPSDLLRLLSDPEARVRRRAALAAGRVGLAEAVGPLSALLKDPEPEVRQMAAFALGLIGDPAARPALTAALTDPEPIVQGRAAEALGAIGNKDDAGAIVAMTRAHIGAGAIALVYPEDLSYPLAPPVEAVRLGLYALVRLGDYGSIASAVLDDAGLRMVADCLRAAAAG